LLLRQHSWLEMINLWVLRHDLVLLRFPQNEFNSNFSLVYWDEWGLNEISQRRKQNFMKWHCFTFWSHVGVWKVLIQSPHPHYEKVLTDDSIFYSLNNTALSHMMKTFWGLTMHYFSGVITIFISIFNEALCYQCSSIRSILIYYRFTNNATLFC